MTSSSTNKNLHSAKAGKNDEFYTQLDDIEKELRHYKDNFKDKVVLCNCDDPRMSNFFKYFSLNFEFLGLKKLIATCYKSQDRDLFSKFDSEKAIYQIYDGAREGERMPNSDDIGVFEFEGDGDFRSSECIDLLKQADIVVTNPPFSLFREFVAQLDEYDKQFLIIGNMNATTYRDIFGLVKQNKLWFGPTIHSGDREFQVPEDYPLNAAGSRTDQEGNKYIRVKGVRWFTNMDFKARHDEMVLYKKYTPAEFPTYDNYDAINVDKTKDIPGDYAGAMGVPITFLDKYNPDQFEILGLAASAGYNGEVVGVPFLGEKDARPIINEKVAYARVFIKNRKPQAN
jgi:Adenine-specific methyltransferase EcoRI